MTRWGGGAYWGDGTLWGSTDEPAGYTTDTLLWTIAFDWNNDGSYDGYNEATRCINMNVMRGRENFIKSDGTGFEPNSVGQAKCLLWNNDRRYDPFNTTSPYYPNVRPGRYAKITVQKGMDGTVYPVITGKIKDIRPHMRGKDRYAEFTIEDGSRLFKDTETFVKLTTDISVSDAIEDVLDDINWNDTLWGRSIQQSRNTISYWWETDRPTDDVLHQLAFDYELGSFTVAADGKATFVKRNPWDTPVLALDQTQILTDIGSPMPWDTIRNKIRIVAHPRVIQEQSVLWTLTDQPLIKAGKNQEIWATFTYDGENVPAENLIEPQPTTDFTAFDVQYGTSDNVEYTSDFIVQILYDFGFQARLRIYNNGTHDAYLNFLQLRGDAIASPDQSVVEEDRSGTEPKSQFKLDMVYIQDIVTANGIVVQLGDYLATERMFPVIAIEDNPDIQFLPDLQELISLDVGLLGLDANYRIGHIKHEWVSENGQFIRTEFILEPTPTFENMWVFEAQFSTSPDEGYYPTVFGY